MRNVAQKHSFWATVGVCVFLIAITWFVFGQTLGHEFTNYDDDTYVYQNPKITAGLSYGGILWAFSHVHAQNWHPLTTISHMLDCQLYGLNARGHHFTNVLLHSLAVLLLFFAMRQMTGAFWRSAFVAAVFAIHPLRVESVAWIAERKDVLSGVFFLATIGAYTHYARNPNAGRYVVMLFLLVCGLMSKPMLMTTPFVLLLLDWWPLRRLPRSDSTRTTAQGRDALSQQSTVPRLVLEKVPLLLVSVASGIITVLAQRQALGLPAELPIRWRITNAFVSYMLYVWQMFWPVKLAVFYPHPENHLPLWEILVAVAFLVVATLAGVAFRKKHPYILTGWLWYLVMLSPVIGVMQVGWQARADRYTYLPQIGLYIVVTWLAANLAVKRQYRQIIAIAAILIICALSWLSQVQASYWRNSETLWRHAASVTRNNDVADNNLGIIFLDRGELDSAIPLFERALSIRSRNAPAHTNLAKALLQQGRVDDALVHYRKSLEIDPENLEPRNIFGTVLFQKGRVREAADEWQRILAIDPNNGNANSNLAWVYATYPDESIRNGPEAVRLAQRALQLSGGKNPVIFRTLAAAYAESGQFSVAIETAERGRELALSQGNSGLVGELDANIALYKSSSPLRDVNPGNVSQP